MIDKTQRKYKKILYVIHGYPPRNYAGTENYSFHLAKTMAKNKFNVAVFYPVFAPNISHKTIQTKTIENHLAFEVKTPCCDTLSNLFDPDVDEIFSNVIRNFKPEIIHFQHIHALFPFSIILESLKNNIPTILTLHDFWYICPKTYMLNNDGSLCDGPSNLEKCAKCFLESVDNKLIFNNDLLNYTKCILETRIKLSRHIFSNSNLTTGPSKFLLDRYKKFVSFKKDLKLPLGLEAPPLKTRKQPSKTIKFGFLGNISPLKNVHGLIESFVRTTGNAELHIFGKMSDTNLFHAIKHLSNNDKRIQVHGPYNPSNLKNILSLLDVGVVPSFFENYPLVVREFLSAKIPVIASRVGGIPEIIAHQKNGLLFDPLNKDDLFNCLQTIIDKPDLIDNLSCQIKNIKTIEQDAHVWSEIYESFIL
jgi:glycosyltransferase involved in cell wall biosynthesis